MLRLMIPHTHQEGMQKFITDIMRLSGEKRAGAHAGSKMVLRKQGKESDLRFMVATGWGWAWVPAYRMGLAWF